jgi:flagellar M-ring protein FliF
MNDSNLMTAAEAQAAQRAAVPAPVAPANAGFGGLNGARFRFTGLLNQPAVQRSLPMIGLVGTTVLAGAAWLALREAPQRDLFRGLPEADQAAVAEVLGKSNIPYSFDKTTGAITVAEDAYFEAKMKLAAEGLPKSAPDGESLINSMPMGASRAVEGEKLRSAREMDLARTIEAIDGVNKARVHLAVQPPSVFLRDRTPPGASVMLQLAGGRALSASQVEAIVHLVASSVPDLTPEAVSVVDQNGRLLSQSTGPGAETDRQIALQSRIEERYRQAVVALLTPIIGAGKFSAEVNAEVNFSERQATRETYPQDEARLRVETGSWNADPKATGEASGVPGALQPLAPPTPTAPGTPPPPAGQVAGANGVAQGVPGAPPFKTAETFNRSFELGREVSVTKDAVGTVRKLSVAVALDNGADGKPRTPQEIAALEALVKGAIGFDATRGDVVALSSRKFAVTPEVPAPWYEASWVGMLVRNISALAVVLVLLLGIGRPLIKRLGTTTRRSGPPPVDQAEQARLSAELQAELAKAAVTNPGATVTIDMISATHDYSDRAALIRNFVKQDPDRAALVVRDLLKEGTRGG